MTLLTWMKRTNTIKARHGSKTKRGEKGKSELRALKEKKSSLGLRAHGLTKIKG